MALTAPKERPILFSSPMIRAILDGRKSMTRRVVKGEALDWLQPGRFTPEFVAHPENHLCPYGRSGDKEWRTGPMPGPGWYCVRHLLAPDCGGNERAVWVDPGSFTWGYDEHDDPEAIGLDTGITPEDIHWKVPSTLLWVREKWRPAQVEGRVWYAATCGDESHERWRPSIHMPKWACRLWLRVTDVRVQRVQEISEEDAVAEGCEPLMVAPGVLNGKARVGGPKREFATLWDSINGKRPGCSWQENPWVWAVAFERTEAPQC